jgi:hypothetical protein
MHTTQKRKKKLKNKKFHYSVPVLIVATQSPPR